MAQIKKMHPLKTHYDILIPKTWSLLQCKPIQFLLLILYQPNLKPVILLNCNKDEK